MKTYLQILLSVLSGILVCISFPTLIAGIHLPEMGWIAWVALVPLIIAIRDRTPRSAFLITFLSGSIWYGGSIFWVWRAMHTFGRLPATTSFLVLVLLVFIVAAYIALAPMFARLIQTRWRGELIVWLPACWVAVELLRNYAPCNGFPWSNVAMSQWRILPLIQIVDIVGVYGLIFLIVWVNVFIAELIARFRNQEVSFLIPKAIMTLVLMAAAAGYGMYRLHQLPRTLSGHESLSVGLIQGNIPQEEKWVDERAGDILNIYRARTRRLVEAGNAEMLVWPEAAFPWHIKVTDTDIDPAVLGFRSSGLIGAPYTMIGAISEENEDTYYNSAILFDASGGIVGRYHKAHLVPFGEYVPYRKILFFARKLTAPVGNFMPGQSYDPLVAGRARAGVLICYEDIFPEIARKETLKGANLLVNITNDAWYGVSSAPYQHLALSVFRAVENRRFLVRSTNSGVSAVIMPTGKIMVESGLFEPALIVSPVALLEHLSLYTLYGDWFAWACLAYAGLGVAMAICRRFSRAA